MTIRIVRITPKRAYAFCPFHKDSMPSLEIKLDGDFLGYYYCYGCGRMGKVGRKVLAKLLEKRPSPRVVKPVPTNWQAMTDKFVLNYLLEGDNRVPFDVPVMVLHKFCMGWDGKAFTFPMRDAGNEIIGIQRRFPDGRKQNMENTRLGLFVPGLPEGTTEMFICEGVSDAAIMVKHGHYAIGRPNCSFGKQLIQEWIQNHAPNLAIWIMADNDKVGLAGARELAEHLKVPESQVLVPQCKDVREQEGKTDDFQGWLQCQKQHAVLN